MKKNLKKSLKKRLGKHRVSCLAAFLMATGLLTTLLIAPTAQALDHPIIVHDLAACSAGDAGPRLNDLQSIGSHNSYKRAIPATELALIRLSSKQAAVELDYAHIPLGEQLDLGMRQLELDVYYDPVGGRYALPLLPKLAGNIGAGGSFDPSGLTAPGFKVFHVQDLDVRSHCVRFVECLAQITAWSTHHPDHTPILILLNAKQDNIDVPGSVLPLPFDAAAFDLLDAEIRTTLDEAKLITPDTVRGQASTLRAAIMTTGWPLLSAAKGKFILALDEAPRTVETYMRGNASLEGLPMFVNSLNRRAAHAAYFTINDPLADGERISATVAQGFLVKTRADANTHEARNNDPKRREAALASGAQYISTDYYLPRPAFSGYHVTLPGGAATRCRPKH